MATIKAYTDLAQSEKLAKILPIESADMCFPHFIKGGADTYCTIPECAEDIDFPYEMPCWSLAALLDILPKRITDVHNTEYFIAITEGNATKWHIGYVDFKENKFISSSSNNIIDACYEMVLELHGQKML